MTEKKRGGNVRDLGGKPGNTYDKGKNTDLTAQDRAEGAEITECVRCENGRRRKKEICWMCGGKGKIRTYR